MAHDRPQRVAQLIQEELGRLLTRGFKDPRIGFITVTGVKLSPDLKEGVIYWSMIGDEAQKKETAKGLKAATGFIKRELGKVLTLRHMPNFRWVFDEAIERGDRIERLLREVREHGQSLPEDAEKPGEKA